MPALGRGGCGCPPHSPSSWEILALLPSLSFSFDPCCPCLQEYIRRQLEEEQRQLEILQQQLLQEQALLLVNGRPRPRLPLSARVASACARVHPCPPSASCHAEAWGMLLSPLDPEPPVPLRGCEHASIPSPPLQAGSPRGARLSHCIPSVASACLCLRERSSPLCCRIVLKAVCSMLECGRAVACLHLANPPCRAGFHILSEGFCFNFLAGTLYIPSCGVCILDVLFFYLICF